MKKNKLKELHEPVLVSEVLTALKVDELAHLNKKVKYIDATVGYGGHTAEIVCLNGHVLGLDADKSTLEIAKDNIERVLATCPTPEDSLRGSYTLTHANFKDIDKIALQFGFDNVSGVLFDLGVSTPQLTSEARGFSFQHAASPLDMRLDTAGQAVTAADLVNALSGAQLHNLFSRVVDYQSAKRLSTNIVQRRNSKAIKNVGDFTEVVKASIESKKNLDVATLPFLALRMAVNSELENLEEALPKAFSLLEKGGRLVVITFHSGEDRVVKNYFRELDKDSLASLVNKKPQLPSVDEITRNPKARSAKLRVVEKV